MKILLMKKRLQLYTNLILSWFCDEKTRKYRTTEILIKRLIDVMKYKKYFLKYKNVLVYLFGEEKQKLE